MIIQQTTNFAPKLPKQSQFLVKNLVFVQNTLSLK